MVCLALQILDAVSFPARGTWIEMPENQYDYTTSESFPARGTWIEINPAAPPCKPIAVVPRKGNVD